jgi:hypothetical protein
MDADKTIIIQLLLQLRVKDPEAVAMLTPTSAEVYVIVFCVPFDGIGAGCKQYSMEYAVCNNYRIGYCA